MLKSFTGQNKLKFIFPVYKLIPSQKVSLLKGLHILSYLSLFMHDLSLIILFFLSLAAFPLIIIHLLCMVS